MFIHLDNTELYNRFYSVTGAFSLPMKPRIFIGNPVTKPYDIYWNQALIPFLWNALTERLLTLMAYPAPAH